MSGEVLRTEGFSRSKSSIFWFAQGAIQQLLGKLDADVFQELRILVHPAIQRHGDLPWPREDLGVLDRGFVRQMVGPRGRITFGHVQRVAVKVSGPVEPGVFVEARDVDDEGLSIPAASRPPPPKFVGTL